jgi:hypothetical protein
LFVSSFLLMSAFSIGNAQNYDLTLVGSGQLAPGTGSEFEFYADRPADAMYVFNNCGFGLLVKLGNGFSTNNNIAARNDTMEVYSVYKGNWLLLTSFSGNEIMNLGGKSTRIGFYPWADTEGIGYVELVVRYHWGGGSERDYPIKSFPFIPYPEVRTNVDGEAIYDYFYGRTTQFTGKVEFSRTGGSKHLQYSIDGWNWKPFGAGNTHVLTPLEIQNLIPGSSILFREPYGCIDAAPWLDVPEPQVLGGLISRSIFIDPADEHGATIVPRAGIHFVESGKKFAFKVFPTGANAGKKPIVTTDRKLLPDAEGGIEVKDNQDGSWTFTLIAVQEPVNVFITYDPEPASATGNATVEDGQVWGAEGVAYITSATAGSVSIYSATGALVKTVAYAAGTTAIPLPSGFYIVSKGDGENYKVIVK